MGGGGGLTITNPRGRSIFGHVSREDVVGEGTIEEENEEKYSKKMALVETMYFH